jgi:hypothetical protein
MKCPVCGKFTSFVNESVPFLWLGTYGDICRAKTKCGHYVQVRSKVSYTIVASEDQKSECDWGY